MIDVTTLAMDEYRDLHGIWPRDAAGLRQLRHAKENGALVGVYSAVEAGLEDEGWATVCEAHSRLVLHDTLTLARSHSANPTGWCGVCRGDEPEDGSVSVNGRQSAMSTTSRYRVHVGDAVEGATLTVTVENGDNDDSELIQAAATARESLLTASITVVKLNDENEEVGSTASFTPADIDEWWA